MMKHNHLLIMLRLLNLLYLVGSITRLLVPIAQPYAPFTLIRFETKTELFCSGYGYCPYYNTENDPRKRSRSKTLSRVHEVI